MKRESVRITFEKGVVDTLERSAAPVGSCQTLINWEPLPNGGLRARTGWVPHGVGQFGHPATKEAAGIGLYSGNTPSNAIMYTAWANTTTEIKISPISAGGYGSAFATHGNAGLTSPPFVWFAEMGSYMYYSSLASTDGLRWLTGTSGGTVSGTTLMSGRALCCHKDRLWSAGPGTHASTSGAPYNRLFYSALGDGTSWTVADDYLDIGQRGAINALMEYQDGLLIGKTNGVFYLQGVSPSTFRLVELDHGECAIGHSMVDTPFGAVIVGTDNIYLWSGGALKELDVNIDWHLRGAFTSATYNKGRLYIADATDDDGETSAENLFGVEAPPPQIYVYDFATDAWWMERVGGVAGTETPRIIWAPPVGAAAPTDKYIWGLTGGDLFDASTMNPYSYAYKRDSYLNRAGDEKVVSATDGPTYYEATTAGYRLGTSQTPVTLTHLYLGVKQRGAEGSSSTNSFTVVPYIDGVAQATKTIPAKTSAGVYRHRIDLGGATGYECYFKFVHNNTSTDNQYAYDIEEAILEYMPAGPTR